MMECPYCDGTGISRYSKDYKYPCTICDGTGHIQTNMEWLQSMSEKPLAYWLANTCRKAMWEDKYDNNDDKSTLDYWKEWLKQPHTTTKE